MKKVESLQMSIGALTADLEKLKGAEEKLKQARSALTARDEKLRAMSKQLDAARSIPFYELRIH